MTNKYTLKDLYRWSIDPDHDNSRNMVLSVEYDLHNQEQVFTSKTIHSPDAQDAQAEIVKAMDKIKQENPELFTDYVSLTEAFDAALSKIESLSNNQLSQILWNYTITVPGTRD